MVGNKFLKNENIFQDILNILKMAELYMQKRFLDFSSPFQNFLLEDDLEKIGNHIDIKEINQPFGDDKYTILMMICRYLKCSVNVDKNFFKKIDRDIIYIPYGIEKIEWLLTVGKADPNIQDKYGWTALMMAARNSSPERCVSSERTIELLLATGVDPNIQDNSGYTALMWAAQDSSPERGTSSERTIELLLAAGADPNKQEKDGWTALMIAAYYSSPENCDSSERTVELLLAAGADPNKQGTYGWTNGYSAIDLATSENVKKMIQKYILAKKWKIPKLINNDKENCPKCHICIDNNKDVMLLTCRHTFCIECIEKILESQKCPNCRESFTESDIQQFIL